MSARDAIDRLNRSRAQIRGEMPDRTPLDYPLGFEAIAEGDAPDEEEALPLAARPAALPLDFPAWALIGLLALAGILGLVGCWPRGVPL